MKKLIVICSFSLAAFYTYAKVSSQCSNLLLSGSSAWEGVWHTKGSKPENAYMRFSSVAPDTDQFKGTFWFQNSSNNPEAISGRCIDNYGYGSLAFKIPSQPGSVPAIALLSKNSQGKEFLWMVIHEKHMQGTFYQTTP